MAETDNAPQKRAPAMRLLTIFIAGIIIILALNILMPEVHRPGEMPLKVICGSNMAQIVKAMYVYANDDDSGRIPPADKWCDLLVMHSYLSPKSFVCKASDAIEGESSYALNSNIAGTNPHLLPRDVVLLFETDFGKNPNGRNDRLKNRPCYQKISYYEPDTEVYGNRWNQAGGPEILTTAHHNGKGCNVVFGDIRTQFVKTSDLHRLKWKTRANDK